MTLKLNQFPDILSHRDRNIKIPQVPILMISIEKLHVSEKLMKFLTTMDRQKRDLLPH